jgi:hypothetical protein
MRKLISESAGKVAQRVRDRFALAMSRRRGRMVLLLEIAVTRGNQAIAKIVELEGRLDERVDRLASEQRASEQRALDQRALDRDQRILDQQAQYRMQTNLTTIVARLVAENAALNHRLTLIEAKSRVAVLVTRASQLPHIRALCLSPLLTQRYDFLIHTRLDPHADGTYRFCRDYGITLFHNYQQVLGDSFYEPYEPTEDFAAPEPSQLPDEAAKVLHGALVEFRSQMRTLKSCRRLMQQMKVSLLVLFEDNAEDDTAIWVAAARDGAIPSVIVPFTNADQVEPAKSHDYDSSSHTDANAFDRFVASHFPRWQAEPGEHQMPRRTGVEAFAAEALGFAAPLPWTPNSSRANVIAVESRAMLEQFKRLGLPSSQLQLTGNARDDEMHAARSRVAELRRRRFSVLPGQRLIVCGFPPRRSVAIGPGCEFATYRDAIDFWFGELNAFNDSVVVIKPDPAVSADDVEYMRTHGYEVSDLSVATLLAACDLYVSSGLPTIRWALALGKPVLNYEMCTHHDPEFAQEEAVVTVHTRDAFKSEIKRWATDEDYLPERTRLADQASRHWGMVDGNSMGRLRALFDSLTVPSVAAADRADRA